MKKLALISVMALTAAGCASPTPHIVQTYVPIGTYGNYSCPMLSDEMMRINRRFTELAGVQDVNAREDTIKAGVAAAGLTTAGLGGAALAGAFGTTAAAYGLYGAAYGTAVPASATTLGIAGVAAGTAAAAGGGALIHGNDGNTNQIALLKGELDTAERAYIQKGCGHHHGHAVVSAAY